MRLRLCLLPILLVPGPLTAEPTASLRELAATPMVTVRIAESVRTPPDQASLTITTTESAPTAAEALEANQNETKELVQAIRDSGIPAKDIQTKGVTIRPNYDWEMIGGRRQQVQKGYIANNSIGVKTRDIDRLPALLDTVTKAGADQLQGPSFQIADPLPLRKDARRRAMVRGEAEAMEYAANAGFSRVRLLSVEEGVSRRSSEIIVRSGLPEGDPIPPPPPPPPPPFAGGIEPGLIDTGITLTLVYRMER